MNLTYPAFQYLIRQRPTLPGPCGPSTIGPDGLNFHVRNENGCNTIGITTGNNLKKNKSKT